MEIVGLDLVEGRAARWRSPSESDVPLGSDASAEAALRRQRIALYIGDILADLPALKRLFAAARPDYVFHLAAQAFVPASWADPWSTLANNIRGQLNVLLAAIELGTYPRVLVVGSADEYGAVAESELPIRETNPLRPTSPYAVSKVAQDMLGYQYYASHNLPTVRVRPFNHIGPGQSPAFVASDFAKQIAEAEAGLREPVVLVGNLDARRDFSDVHDIVRGYYLALSMGEAGEVYNLGSERSYAIRDILEGLMQLSAITLAVREEPARLRPADVQEIVADCTKLRSRTGWQAQIPLQQTLKDILEYWRDQVQKKSRSGE